MSDFSVEPEPLGALGATLETAHSELSATLERLSHASHAMSGQWSGAAQQAYLGRFAEWSAAMRHLDAVLRSAGAAAREISENYRSTDERVAALWRI